MRGQLRRLQGAEQADSQLHAPSDVSGREQRHSVRLPGYYLNGASWTPVRCARPVRRPTAQHSRRCATTYVDSLVNRWPPNSAPGPGPRRPIRPRFSSARPPGFLKRSLRSGRQPSRNACRLRVEHVCRPAAVGQRPGTGGLAPPLACSIRRPRARPDLTGSIPVTGWALDDSRGDERPPPARPVAGEPPGTPVFIGSAVFVGGARPDVASVYPAYPTQRLAQAGAICC